MKTVSADEIANAFTRHLGFSSGLLPLDALWWGQGETGQVGGPVEAAPGVAGGPATGGVQAPRTAQDSHAGPRLRLLAGTRSLGLRRAGADPANPEQRLYRTPAFNVFRDGTGLPR